MKNLIAALFFLICVTAHAANPSMAQLNFASNAIVAQISAAQVWTNDGSFIYPLGLPKPIVGSNTFFAYRSDGSGQNLKITYNEIQINSTNSQGIVGGFDLYSYNNIGDTLSPVLTMVTDNGSAYSVLIDPMSDDGQEAFRFSSGYSNVIAAASTLYAVQNGHADRFLITGEGGLWTPTFQSTSTKTTNATPLDVAGQLGLYKGTNYINFPATNTPPGSAVAPVRWITVTVDGTIYRMPLYL